MELDAYVDRLRTEFAAISEVAGRDVQEVAERLVAPLESALRLVLLEALAAAADEITLELAPGSVHLRLRGGDPDFVVTPDLASTATANGSPPAPAPQAPESGSSVTPPGDIDGGAVARINFRPPESLKTRIEQAAGRDGLSVNTWLSRVAAAALEKSAHHPSERGRAARGGWFA